MSFRTGQPWVRTPPVLQYLTWLCQRTENNLWEKSGASQVWDTDGGGSHAGTRATYGGSSRLQQCCQRHLAGWTHTLCTTGELSKLTEAGQHFLEFFTTSRKAVMSQHTSARTSFLVHTGRYVASVKSLLRYVLQYLSLPKTRLSVLLFYLICCPKRYLRIFLIHSGQFLTSQAAWGQQ